LKPIVSVSTVAYDGYPLSEAFQSISRIGARYVESAFIQGYMGAFGEELFTDAYARELRRRMQDAGLCCHAFSSHLDLGAEGAAHARDSFSLDPAELRFRQRDFTLEGSGTPGAVARGPAGANRITGGLSGHFPFARAVRRSAAYNPYS